MQAEFVIKGQPQGKGRPRFASRGKYVQTYTPERTVSYENLARVEYERQSNVDFEEKALKMIITAFLEIPKSASKKKRQEMLNDFIKPCKKPDADNIAKIICDSLNSYAYKDDAQIVELTVRKFYSIVPRVEVKITECEETRLI